MPDVVWKAGDTQPAFIDQLTLADGSAPSLEKATITLAIRSGTSTGLLPLAGMVELIDPSTNQVSFIPAATDTATPANYLANWIVTFPDDSQMTWPTDGYIWIRIEESLASMPQELVSLGDVKAMLASFSSYDRSHDAKLLGYIEAATPVVENIVGPIILRTFEEWHDGGQTFIQLRRRPSSALGTTPVLTIMACEEFRGPIRYELSIVADPTEATIYSVMLDPKIGTLYRRSTGGGLIPFGAGWTGSAPQAVHVVYQAGQASVPANVREATLEAIRQHYQTTLATGTGSRAMADSFDGPTLGPSFTQLLDRIARQSLAPMRRHPSVA